MKKIFLFLCIAYASPALALTCLNDYSGVAGCASNADAAGDCATLGYSTDSVSGCNQYLYCPFNSSYKRCVSNNDNTAVDCTALGFTATDKSAWCSKIVKCKDNTALTLCEKNLTCESNEILINGQCVKVYTSCSAAGYFAPSECTAGYTCSGDVSIYTSTTGTTANCYKFRLEKRCPTGYATAVANCNKTPDGETCGTYMFKRRLLNSEAPFYAGELACEECACGITVNNCTGSTTCPTGATCSSCNDTNGKTLYTVTGCSSGYVKDGNSCYDCAGMQSRMNNAIKKGTGNGYKQYIQACYGRWCETDSNTSCSGNNGTRAWDQYCVCSIIGSQYCVKQTSAGDLIYKDPNDAPPCSREEKARCEAARDAFNAKVAEHNNKCSSYKVTGTISFSCEYYLPEGDGMSVSYLTTCTY